ncbi:DUF3054 domain-containing protein, partial [Mycobacterium tuberculosis]|uniref:DUF3054 domain-containing protein n=1 Tax=Mycobacterium tuberculosis TaxID=1773 RepID=UPI00207422F1
MRPRRALAGLAADVVAVLVFCAVGRRSHAEGLSVTGLAATAWPFLTGTGIGWVLAPGWGGGGPPPPPRGGGGG